MYKILGALRKPSPWRTVTHACFKNYYPHRLGRRPGLFAPWNDQDPKPTMSRPQPWALKGAKSSE